MKEQVESAEANFSSGGCRRGGGTEVQIRDVPSLMVDEQPSQGSVADGDFHVCRVFTSVYTLLQKLFLLLCVRGNWNRRVEKVRW